MVELKSMVWRFDQPRARASNRTMVELKWKWNCGPGYWTCFQSYHGGIEIRCFSMRPIQYIIFQSYHGGIEMVEKTRSRMKDELLPIVPWWN